MRPASRHALVVGGTGMLAGVVGALAAEGWRVSVLARRASAFAEGRGVLGLDCDYNDVAAFEAALARSEQAHGPVTLAVAWFHSLKIDAPRRLAERMRGRLVQVLGSAVADPARPDRLQLAAAVAEGLPDCELSQVVLGFRLDSGRARWNTDAEIAAGVLAAIASPQRLSHVGQVEPWSARP